MIMFNRDILLAEDLFCNIFQVYIFQGIINYTVIYIEAFVMRITCKRALFLRGFNSWPQLLRPDKIRDTSARFYIELV